MFSHRLILIISLFTLFQLPFLKVDGKQNQLCKNNKVTNQTNLGFYLLGPGDIININVFSNDKFSGDYEILNDGSVSLPIVGPTVFAGLSIRSAIEKLENVLDKEIYAPVLDITLKSARPPSISIIGEVNRPGVYTIEKNISSTNLIVQDKSNKNSLPRLVDALSAAGGVTNNANINSICLIRKKSLELDDVIYFNFSLGELIKNGQQINNPFLFDEDIIKISRFDINNDKVVNKDILKSTIAPEFININIIGEVNSPGNKKVKNNINLIEAISSAGGTTFLSSRGNAEILRVKDDGRIERKRYKFNLDKVDDSLNQEILDGDTILVKRNNFGKTTSLIMKLSEPFLNIFRIIQINDELKN